MSGAKQLLWVEQQLLKRVLSPPRPSLGTVRRGFKQASQVGLWLGSGRCVNVCVSGYVRVACSVQAERLPQRPEKVPVNPPSCTGMPCGLPDGDGVWDVCVVYGERDVQRGMRGSGVQRA